jgi:hypothetical protein
MPVGHHAIRNPSTIVNRSPSIIVLTLSGTEENQSVWFSS